MTEAKAFIIFHYINKTLPVLCQPVYYYRLGLGIQYKENIWKRRGDGPWPGARLCRETAAAPTLSTARNPAVRLADVSVLKSHRQKLLFLKQVAFVPQKIAAIS
ncbi:MAG TPA: hypothetical protein DCR87_07075 [Acidobacteria bacterium]|nr:hypothetical protein [Acidobacteriota bacterium]